MFPVTKQAKSALLVFESVIKWDEQAQEQDSLAKYSYKELHDLINATKFDQQEKAKIYTE